MNQMRRSVLGQLGLAVLAASAFLVSPAPASANMVFQTPDGALNSNNNAVSASADFTVSAGQIVVTISNTLASSISADNQTINGITFDITPTGGSVTGNTTGTGTYINIAGDGTFSTVSSEPWGSNSTVKKGVETIEISSLLASNGGGSPTIINTQANYSSGNGSITNGNHDPFIQGSATFTIPVSGLLGTATISNVVFEFGTQAGNDVSVPTATPQAAVPEPSTGILASTAIALVLGYTWRRRSRG
jgi:hypothetical protein